MKYIKKILKNKLTVIEVPSHDAESVVVDFFVKTGSRSESEKEAGISHFLEHFLFKGTKKYPSALAISSLIDSIGGEMNANTGKEHTQYYIKAASHHLPLIFEVLSDMVQNPLLDTVELEREKGVIVEELNMYKDTPMYYIENVLENTMWPTDTLGKDIIGSKETIMAMTREMFLQYIGRHYKTENMILGVSGKYDKQVLWKLIGKYWQEKTSPMHHQVHDRLVSSLSRRGMNTTFGPGKHWEKVKDVQTEVRLKVKFKETEQAHIALGFKGLKYGDKRAFAQSVLSAILGGGMSSRLFTEVREKRGLAYYVSASGSNYQDTGSFTVRAGVQVDKIEEAISVILTELEKIKAEKISVKELKKAKEFLKGKTVLALEDNQVRLDWFLESQAFKPKVLTPKEVFKKIDAVTSSQVQNFARELFRKEILSLAVLGPYKDKEVFRKLL